MRAWLIGVIATAIWVPGTSLAQAPASPPRAAPPTAQKSAPKSPPAGQKTNKDPNEYNAYVKALNTTDPAQKAAAMDAFIARYPKSVMHLEALRQAMAAYQQAGNLAKVEDSAERLLTVAPKDVRALAVLALIERNQVTQGKTDMRDRLRAHVTVGLAALPDWKKPPDMDATTFKQVHDNVSAVLNGAAGFLAAQDKDYAKAAEHYRVVVALTPGSLPDIYQLGIALLEGKPIDATGFWYIGKAIALTKSNPAAQKSIAAYGAARYRKYHGGDDGWDDIVAHAAAQAAPPADFVASIKTAPTAADIAVEAVRNNDPNDMSFSDYEFILALRDASPANKDAADKVWQAIRAHERNGAAKLKIPVKIISTTRDTVLAAISEDNQKANKADLQIAMKQPIAAPPAPGASVAVIGVITDYVPSPFMFIMKDGELSSP